MAPSELVGNQNDRELQRLIAQAGTQAEFFNRTVMDLLSVGCKVTDEEMQTIERLRGLATDLSEAAAKTRE